MTDTAMQRIHDALEAGGWGPVKRGVGYRFRCPAHDGGDRNASLYPDHERARLKCFSHGCHDEDMLEAIGLGVADLFDNRRESRYEYRASTGEVEALVSRHYKPDAKPGKKAKGFKQNVKVKSSTVLYNLTAVAQAVANGEPVYFVEGESDVHALAHHGATATTARQGGGSVGGADLTPLAGAHVIAVMDNDPTGQKWAQTLTEGLAAVGATVDLTRPAVDHEGADVTDHLMAGHTLDELIPVDDPTDPTKPPVEPVTLAECHSVFTRWLGADYDLDALDVTLAAAAVERLDGDPLWLLVISGSGNAKTETVQALAGAGALLTSTIRSEGALLSATSKRERSKAATGGLLREIGDRGVLVIKDVTSILSMQRDARAEVLGALREVYDGSWTRHVGTDGGQSLSWAGRVVVVGAVTTAWDKAHAVIASMGDRFVLIRMDSTTGRQAAGRRAIGNTGSEVQMRAELSEAVAGVLARVKPTDGVNVTDEESDRLLAAADLVTLARTGVEFDYRGDVIDAHAPEMPTRFAKQLAQVVRGAVAIGVDRAEAMRLAVRSARDSLPPMRLAIIDDLAAHPDSTTTEVRKRIGKPRATVDRQLQALHMLGVLDCDEEETHVAGKPGTRWSYRLAEGIDPDALRPLRVPEMSVPTPNPLEGGGKKSVSNETSRPGTYISGTDDRPMCPCGDRHLAGQRELDAGRCTHCQRIAAANARAEGVR
ncbi:hypothetical protein SAMN05445756_1536 [Kytococcus aerolatus]|uniref:Toprim domain-containing protein n=1 Tax=Kytococcus aerolatus TaxID=592308 RepID=A0A212TZX5_9MICO|nr:hypothetical protein [Kytococcus aerolatus]SNC71555.1 hypothetical protein SAMN05445756_1536 [Kytococcus aerolatus]